MKKSVLALSILSAFTGAAFAQTNVTVYGIADAGISYSDNGAATNSKTTGVDSGLQSGSRIGFRGTEDLGGGLSAIFTLENGFSVDTGTLGQGNRLFGRQAFVGLNGGFGTIKLGRQYNPIRPALESVDPFGLGLAGNAENFFNTYGSRSDNAIVYAIPTIGGFSGQILYSFGEVPGSSSIGRQWGFSAGYAAGPINAVVAYHDQNVTAGTAPALTAAGNAKTTLLGATYDFGIVKAHGAYAWNKGDAASGATSVDSRDMMLGVSAPVGAGTVLASYMRKNNKLVGNADANVWAIGYSYELSKRTNLYTSYGRATNDTAAVVGFGTTATTPTAGNDPSMFNVGIRHKF